MPSPVNRPVNRTVPDRIKNDGLIREPVSHAARGASATRGDCYNLADYTAERSRLAQRTV